ncbi:MAG TPA: hypothetical protein VMI56_17460 [Reyranella sp.]|nr:hypothetical protein [Reyranella sp.]
MPISLRTLFAAGLALAMSHAVRAEDRFDLRCTLTSRVAGAPAATTRIVVLKIDLEDRRYAQGDDAPQAIHEVTATELILQSDRSRLLRIDRRSGAYLFKFEDPAAGRGIVSTGDCTSVPFSGFAKGS